jgi:branched-subunit amino acid aminotransferase/4-amino-4-deoxychorismate lyase
VAAGRFFKWTAVESISCLENDQAWEEYLLSEVREHQKQTGLSETTPLRYRIAINKEGRMRTEFFEVPPTTLEALFPASLPPPEKLKGKSKLVSIILDTEETEISPFTYQKTTMRDHYNTARERMARILTDLDINDHHSDSEIILHSLKGEITEGSVTNVYFWRDGWVTPPVGPEGGGLPGTARKYAFQRGFCREEKVMKGSIKTGDLVWISNGVRGFSPGMVVWTVGTENSEFRTDDVEA